MQNKYKLPDDVRSTVIGIVRGYNRRAEEIRARENEICSVSGGHYETYKVGEKEYREFTPGGKNKVSSPVESQADALARYHATDSDYLRNKLIDEVLEDLPLVRFSDDVATEIKKNIIKSCIKGRNYNFNYSGIYAIGRSRFYQFRNIFLYNLSKKLNFF